MATELLTHWLHTTYSMEVAQLPLLEQLIINFDRYPDMKGELRQHLIETKQQAGDLQQCLTKLGITPHATAIPPPFAAWAESLQSEPAEDTLTKNLLVLHAMEHFEHITYIALAEAARQTGEDEIADICERIAEEEAAMAEWIEEQVPAVITALLTSPATI